MNNKTELNNVSIEMMTTTILSAKYEGNVFVVLGDALGCRERQKRYFFILNMSHLRRIKE